MTNDLFWHYTTPEGLTGIIEENSLWATDVFYLNDSMEFMHGINIAREIIKQKMLSFDGDKIFRLERFDENLSFIGPDHKRPIYVCSLSKTENDLSQWRAYCRGGGFSIGFPHQGLVDAIQGQHFDLKKCVYDIDTQKDIIAHLIDLHVMPYIENPRQFSEIPCTEDMISGVVSTGIDKFIWILSSTCSVLKHSSFEQEEEWRLVFDHGYAFEKDENDKNKIGPEFRTKAGLIIPYTHIKLPEHEDFWRKVRIVIGPTKYEKELMSSVHTLFRKSHGTEIIITHSEIPFREL